MIGMIAGQVAHLSAPVACVMTSGGVGYEIEMTIGGFCTLSVGMNVTLYTQLVVREDAHLLFGFTDKSEREIFKKLIKINGVGAKMALAILSTLPPSELHQAVEYGDESALTRVAGIGKKTAQRLIIELKGKLDSTSNDLFTPSTTQDEPIHTANPMHVIYETESALVSLGYKEKEAQSAIKTAKQSLSDDELTTSNLLKASLKILSGF
ncbi:Holliday junction ATP-dependent DNA helicase RuvA [Moraxella lacunata]|uniref:Holliday junction branch migration complex subunit RuvA n=1 Tax=Moraxella lacunata TaxID=477 RepID=A0A378T444_MORLA|nr:Holliday junction branch migration protein RuvA [Moraxella lacunata]STZ55430.1 Holliday junction ATP-dependent DNA helicase RuvA [Moraxella lacunata]